MSQEERRNAPRVSVQMEVTEEYLGEEQQVTCINVSEHGMHYQKPAGTPSRKGEEVLLTFSLIDRLNPIKALGWVVDERPLGEYVSTHVTFMFLPDKDEEYIREYVATLHQA